MKRPKLEQPIRTALLYLLFGGLWILLSDWLLPRLSAHDTLVTSHQTLREWFFILVSGGLLYLLLQMDLAGRRRAETALRESEQKYSLLFDKSAVPAALLKLPQVTIIQANEALEKLVGFTQEEMFGKNAAELRLTTFDERNQIIDRFEREGSLSGNEMRLLTKSGEERIVLVNTNPLELRGQRYALSTMQDITERKRAEAEIVWLASFPERNPNPVVEIDASGAVFYMNPAAQIRFPDLKEQGFKHPWLAGLELEVPRLQRGDTRKLQREVQFGSAWYAQPIHYVLETGRLRVYGNDITERKQAEHKTAQMKRLYATLSQVNQAIVRIESREELYQTICEVAVQFGEFALAWIGLLDESTGDVSPAAAKGMDLNQGLFPIVNLHTGPLTQGLIAQALRTSRVVTSGNSQNDEHLRAQMHEHGFHSAAAVPFRLQGEAIGVLLLLSREKELFSDINELNLLDEMGLDVSFALDRIESEAKRKRAEEARELANARFQRMIAANIVGIVIGDTAGKVVLANDYYLKLLQVTRQDFLEGKVDWRKFTPPEWLPVDENAIRELLARGVCEPYEKEYIRSDGTRVSVYIVDAMLPGPNEQIIAFIVDITERKRAEEARRASEERFRLLFENNHTVMMLIEPASGAIREANRAAADFYGYSLAELCTMSINLINQLTPEEVYAERLRALKEERNYFHFEHRLANGEIRSVEVHSAPMEVDGGTLLFSIVYDITERKRAEAERQARSRQLAALLEASQALTESLNLAEVLQKITDKAAHILGVDKTALYLVEGEHLYLGASTPSLPSELPETFRRAALVDHPHIAEALSTGLPVLVPDTDSAALTRAEKIISNAIGLRASLYVPLGSGKDLAGVLILGSVGTPRQFSRDEEDVARALANHASLAIANARLYQDLSLHLGELEAQIAGRRQAQEHFHMAVESAPNAIMLVGSDGRLRMVNAQVENYFGYDRTELIGMEIEQLIPNRFRTQHIVHLAAFLAVPHPKPMGMGRDLYALRKDGTEFPAEIGLTPLESSDEPLVMVSIVDITARKYAEEKLRRHINYLTGLREVDQAIASSFDVRLSLNILTTRTVPLLKVDAAAILLLDPVMNTLEYVAGQGLRKNILHTGSVRLSESYAGKVVMERRIVQIPNLANENHEWPKGLLHEENFVSYYGVPLIVKGKVVGVMEVFHRTLVNRDQEWFDFLNSLAGQAAIAIDNARLWDQVQRHARDLELRVADRTAALNRTNAELEHANRAKDEFLANMSHELRTPLNSILGLSESLLEQRRDPLTEYQQRSLEIISSSGHHLLELINDVLDISKIEAGKFDHYPQSVNIDMLCRSSLTFVKSQAARKSIRLTYESVLPQLNISADPRRLKQILVNLLTNAVKFTPEGGRVTLEVTVDTEQGLVKFSVADNGIGIAPQDLKRLFQPFVQVDSKLNRQFEGTGLGLALVHKLTDMHGGSVHVESQVGAGSRFTIRLPWDHDGIVSQTIAEPEQSASADDIAKANAVVSKKGMVLLAEDNMANIMTIGEYLENHGYQVVNAHDGLEAIEKAKAHKPDVILMDIQMPVMDGMEAIRRLRTDTRFASTPIVVTTALAMSGDRERCLEAGADAYMTKPVRLKVLKQTIEKLLNDC